MRRNTHLVRSVAILFLLTLSLLPGSQAQERPSQSALPAASGAPTSAATLAMGGIRINEVMPKPGAGQFEWVELYNPVIYNVYLPAVLRNAPGATGAASSAFRIGTGESVVSGGPEAIGGWQITDEDGHSYAIPAALPVVPRNAYVLIIFDGLGPAADDYDLSDGVAVLHSLPGLVDVFEDAADQVALYRSGTPSPTTIVDYLAWGAPPAEDAADAYAVDLWDTSSYVSFQVGFGALTEDALLPKNESLGRYPGSTGGGSQAFSLYQNAELTPGTANPVPLPHFYTPGYGAVVETESFSFSWSPTPGADAYDVQLDDDFGFGSPLYDTEVTDTYYVPPSPLTAGDYYWRIRASSLAGASPWTPAVAFGIVDFSTLETGAVSQQEASLGISPVLQNKDSRLLCLAGDPEGDRSTNSPENAWDAPAPCTTPPCADYTKFRHGKMYCVAASIRMVTSHYGGALSMDRIVYHYMEEWLDNPQPDTHDGKLNNDLAHGARGTWDSEATETISWALGTPIPMIEGKPSFTVITTTIESGAPIMFGEDGHMMVIDGYRALGDMEFIHVLDPDEPPLLWRWQEYASQEIISYWAGPISAPGVRSDEASVYTDSDGDGIMDFDEANRFATGVADSDTDDDERSDKIDIREYVFDAHGSYARRKADYDEDLLRMEVDADSDNGGTEDGCEDSNHNGIYEPDMEETSNYNPDADQECVNNPPDTPTNPSPANGATVLSPNVTLVDWTGGDPDEDAVTYQVYLEADDSNPTTLVCSTASSSCDPPDTFADDTTYYWRVDATDEHGLTTSGPVWSFRIDINHPPNRPTSVWPPDHATGVGLSPILSWTSGGDPDGDAVCFRVWIAANGVWGPFPACGWSLATTCSVGPLLPGTEIWWEIEGRDEHLQYFTPDIYSFTTIASGGTGY